MSALKKVAEKLSGPSHTEHHDASLASGGYVASSTTEVHTDRHMDAHAVRTGEIVEQRKVGEVEVVETIQQVRTVPVVETTRTVETVNSGVAGLDIHSEAHAHGHAHGHAHNMEAHASHKTELAHTHDSRTVVVDAVVEERLRKDVLVQVQPVIHKEVEKEVVHHVEKHITEAAAASVAGTVTLQPVVQEHIHTHIVEEIHPIIHREIVVQEVERVEEHITEHVRVPTQHVHEVIVEKEVHPVHIHDHSCHHEIATERLTNVIVPGTVGLAAVGTAHTHAGGAVNTASTVTTREVLVDQAGPAVTTSRHAEVVTDQHLLATAGAHTTSTKVVDVHTTGGALYTDSHLAHSGGAGALHTDRVVETHEFVEDGHAEKKHHHLHLPHFLHSHKDKDHVVVEETTTTTVHTAAK